MPAEEARSHFRAVCPPRHRQRRQGPGDLWWKFSRREIGGHFSDKMIGSIGNLSAMLTFIGRIAQL
jgi:hypothetical protein